MSNFSEMFRKDMAYDNIMIPKKKEKKKTVSLCLWKTRFWKNHRRNSN